MIDRKIPPPIKTIRKLHLPKPKMMTLANGIPVHIINMGTQDVIKLQLVFKAGRPFEKKKLIAKTTSRLIKEGTSEHTSAEIAERIDFYGATLSTPTNLDDSHLVLYCLTKHFKSLIPLVSELLIKPTFPQEELNTFIENSKRRLRIDLSKNDVLAYRKITEYIFGSTHPYGYNSDEKAFDVIKRADLVKHFNRNYTAQNCQLFISGKVEESTLKLLDQYLGQLPRGKKRYRPKLTHSVEKPQKIHIDLPDSMQTAIRIGCRMMDRKHPDFPGFMMLNTILGGYFGSRLMMNIREKKGYTYNIYSTMDTMSYDACFYIGAEVSNEFIRATTKEIFKEINLLQAELVSEKELQTVRNYLLGNMLNMVDGPFNVANVIKTMVIENLPSNSFDKLVDTINTISAKELRTLAQKYLKRENMWEVTVG